MERYKAFTVNAWKAIAKTKAGEVEVIDIDDFFNNDNNDIKQATSISINILKFLNNNRRYNNPYHKALYVIEELRSGLPGIDHVLKLLVSSIEARGKNRQFTITSSVFPKQLLQHMVYYINRVLNHNTLEVQGGNRVTRYLQDRDYTSISNNDNWMDSLQDTKYNQLNIKVFSNILESGHKTIVSSVDKQQGDDI